MYSAVLKGAREHVTCTLDIGVQKRGGAFEIWSLAHPEALDALARVLPRARSKHFALV